MTPENYEIALLANSAWRLAKVNDINELVAICCVIRNHAVPRMGVGLSRSYSEVIEDFLSTYPLRPNPAINEPLLVASGGLFEVIDDIYHCSYVDITASRSQPLGAKFFARVQNMPEDDWRWEIIRDQAHHPLIGGFGGQNFYA